MVRVAVVVFLFAVADLLLFFAGEILIPSEDELRKSIKSTVEDFAGAGEKKLHSLRGSLRKCVANAMRVKDERKRKKNLNNCVLIAKKKTFSISKLQALTEMFLVLVISGFFVILLSLCFVVRSRRRRARNGDVFSGINVPLPYGEDAEAVEDKGHQEMSSFHTSEQGIPALDDEMFEPPPGFTREHEAEFLLSGLPVVKRDQLEEKLPPAPFSGSASSGTRTEISMRNLSEEASVTVEIGSSSDHDEIGTGEQSSFMKKVSEVEGTAVTRFGAAAYRNDTVAGEDISPLDLKETISGSSRSAEVQIPEIKGAVHNLPSNGKLPPPPVFQKIAPEDSVPEDGGKVSVKSVEPVKEVKVEYASFDTTVTNISEDGVKLPPVPSHEVSSGNPEGETPEEFISRPDNRSGGTISGLNSTGIEFSKFDVTRIEEGAETEDSTRVPPFTSGGAKAPPPPGVSSARAGKRIPPPPGVPPARAGKGVPPPPGVSSARAGKGAPPPPGVSLARAGKGAPPPPGVSSARAGKGAPSPPGVSLARAGKGASSPPGVSLARAGKGAPPLKVMPAGEEEDDASQNSSKPGSPPSHIKPDVSANDPGRVYKEKSKAISDVPGERGGKTGGPPDAQEGLKQEGVSSKGILFPESLRVENLDERRSASKREEAILNGTSDEESEEGEFRVLPFRINESRDVINNDDLDFALPAFRVATEKKSE